LILYKHEDIGEALPVRPVTEPASTDLAPLNDLEAEAFQRGDVPGSHRLTLAVADMVLDVE
jgi:hypothetical protein